MVWLDKFQDGGFGPETSVLTSLPDIAEMPELFRGFHVEEYKAWFVKTMSKIMSKLCVGCYMIVMQSDIRMMNNDREIFEWVDKGHLASTAADKQNMTLVWHKLVSY
ncbi:hypothetical protein EON65_14435 [archaeon]|nr:MAG: hypothetical protein EON65_14435 [archaeon]